MVRWNALAMVVRANRRAIGELGGHIASYASAADLFEVGFNHFFRARGDGSRRRPRLLPAAFGAGRLCARVPRRAARREEHLAALSRARSAARGLSSYPHPWLMPDFWQFPTGSMGIGPINAIYQARFMRYLQHRGLLAPGAARKVSGASSATARWTSPNRSPRSRSPRASSSTTCAFVINCNLQRLDGPVRGNGRIVQELERSSPARAGT